MLPSARKVTFGLLATITFEVVPFRAYALFTAIMPFLKASKRSCSVREFSTAYDSASITLIVSKWWPISFIFCRENRKVEWVGKRVKSFLVKHLLVKKEI
jgi:hypothetical protein